MTDISEGMASNGGERPPAINPDQRTREKIREAYQSNYRAVLNMLSSLTASERATTLGDSTSATDYAHDEAMVTLETVYGHAAVDAALGKTG